MGKTNALSVAKTAAQSALGNPHWDYAVKDCQGFVEWCWEKNGYKIDYRGSNDMYRNIKGRMCTVKEAQAEGILLPGAVLYKWAKDGGEPDRYKADGMGNARHVGIYCGGIDGVEVAHSSTGGTQTGKLSGGWTHVQLPDFIDFNVTAPTEPTQPSQPIQPSQPSIGSRPTLRKGDKGDYVRELQMRLMDVGYSLPKYGADGGFGDETVAAVKGFQGREGLTVDGIVGKATWAALLADSSEQVLPTEPMPEQPLPEHPTEPIPEQPLPEQPLPAHSGYRVVVFAFKGEPLTADQSSELMDEFRNAGYASMREEVYG